MTEVLSAAQMRAAEQAAINSGKATGLSLMERAGQSVVDAVLERWRDLAENPFRAVVLCGPGNNGGDGFVVARLLRQWGCDVDLFLMGSPGALPPDARVNHDRWVALGPVQKMPDSVPEAWDAARTLIVDAVFGTGLTRPFADFPALRGFLGRATRARTVAIDLPSGLCADSGRFLSKGGSEADVLNAHANLTVSFHRAKLGHYLAEGPAACGALVVQDIGLEEAREDTAPVRLTGQRDLGRLAKQQGHKFSHGHALVLSGGVGQTGAARLAARAALRIGAGLVTIGVPPAALLEVACQITALMVRRIGTADDLQEALADPRITAVCLGPGLGLHDAAAKLVETALSTRLPIVLDADALTLLARSEGQFELLHAQSVLTPHWGEFQRLFPTEAAELSGPADRGPAVYKVDAVRRAAARAGCAVLLKGPDTVIADASGACWINAAFYDRQAPWLATAGSGDVLAGFIAGGLARGLTPLQAARTGAYAHLAAARLFGPGLIAEDLPEILPQVLSASPT